MAGATRASEVICPTEFQEELPPGTLIYSFDGEMLFRSKVSSTDGEMREFSLLPIVENAQMYERRWPDSAPPYSYVPLEQFNGHVVTLFYFFIPRKDTAKTGTYRPANFAAFSWSVHQWAWVTDPAAVAEIFGDSFSFAKLFLKLLFIPGWYFTFKGIQKRNQRIAQYANTLDRLVTFLRFDMHAALQRGGAQGGRL